MEKKDQMEEGKMNTSNEEMKMDSSVESEVEKMSGVSSESSSMPSSSHMASGADTHKALAVLGYILPILFFLPMLAEKKDAFAMYHANQQLTLLLSAIVVQVVGTVIPFLGWFLILPVGMLVLIVLAIMGVIHAAKGEMKPLPIIGGFTLLK